MTGRKLALGLPVPTELHCHLLPSAPVGNLGAYHSLGLVFPCVCLKFTLTWRTALQSNREDSGPPTTLLGPQYAHALEEMRGRLLPVEFYLI